MKGINYCVGYCIVFMHVFMVLPSLGQRVIYVNHTAAGATTGSSWANAYPNLQDALAAARSGDEIWVAGGTYRPDEGAGIAEGDRSASFHLRAGIALYGGFEGSETERDERDWTHNPTVMSGDLLMNDADSVSIYEPSRLENSYHVVSVLDEINMVTIDGFVIEAGNSDGTDNNPSGGGLDIRNASVSIQNVTIKNNSAALEGGGARIFNSKVVIHRTMFSRNVASSINQVARGGGLHMMSSSAEFSKVEFVENIATDAGGMVNVSNDMVTMQDVQFIENRGSLGGGLYNFDSNPFIVNSRFLRNEGYEGGGGMLNELSNPVLMNVVFSGNRIVGTQFFGGGGLLNYQSRPRIINCVFSMNHVEKEGGAIYNLERDSVFIVNSILWGNTSSDGTQLFNSDLSDYTELQSTTTLSHSIMQGELTRHTVDLGGNLALDPLFIDPLGPDGEPGTEDDDFRLQMGSPAIDAGDNTALPDDAIDSDTDGDVAEVFPVDFAGNLRIFDGGGGIFRVDLGVHEFNAPPVDVSMEKDPQVAREEALVLDFYPNPASSLAVLHVNGSAGEYLSIFLYDLLGREVMQVFSGMRGYDRNQFELDTSSVTSGVYVLMIVGERSRLARKIMVVH
jgi:Secretion system C-terminal sorting domain